MPNRKLTYSTAMKIREILNSSRMISSSKVIKMLNLAVSTSCIDKIRQGKNYKSRLQPRASKLTYRDKIGIKNKFKLGWKPASIAHHYDVSVTTINNVKKND